MGWTLRSLGVFWNLSWSLWRSLKVPGRPRLPAVVGSDSSLLSPDSLWCRRPGVLKVLINFYSQASSWSLL